MNDSKNSHPAQFRDRCSAPVSVKPHFFPSISSGTSANRYKFLEFILLIRIADFCFFVLAAISGYIYLFEAWTDRPQSSDFFIFVISCIFSSSLHLAHVYELDAIFSGTEQGKRLLYGVATGVGCMVIIGYFSGVLEDYSREWVYTSIVIGGTFLVLSRVAVAIFFHVSKGANQLKESVVIIGANEQAERMLSWVLTARFSQIKVLGVFDDRVRRAVSPCFKNCLLGSTDSFLEYARKNHVDRVVVALPWSASKRINELLDKCRTVPTQIDLLPDNLVWNISSVAMERLGGVPVVTVANSRLVAQSGLLKRIEDIVLSVFLILLTMPVMALIGIAIKIDSKGPILFKQKRYGYNNKVIEVYKFRSMCATASQSCIFVQASRNDPRITRLGKFLRRSSLDELPQLFNVLVGNMSIVGPRPHAVIQNEEYGALISAYFARHNVKPGITGWAQVNGLRGEICDPSQMHSRVQHDLYYIEHWSLLLDLKIIFLTSIVVWFHKSAY